MPTVWADEKRVDGDGNTVITHLKGYVDGESLLREFRARNSLVKSHPYMQEIEGEIALRGERSARANSPLQKRVRRTYRGDTSRGVWSPRTKPYVPLGSMDDVGKCFMETESTVKAPVRSQTTREEPDATMLEEATQDEFVLKTRSRRMAAPRFPVNLVVSSGRIVKQVKCGQEFRAGTRTVQSRVGRFSKLLHLEPRPPSSPKVQTGYSAMDIALAIKDATNGAVNITVEAEDPARIHMYTANVGKHAKKAALHTERERLERKAREEKKTAARLASKFLATGGGRRKVEPHEHALQGRRKGQGKVENWMDSFCSLSRLCKDKLSDTLTERSLDHIEIADHIQRNWSGWGFGTIKADGTLHTTMGARGSKPKPNIWSRRRNELVGKVEEQLFGRSVKLAYRQLVVFSVNLPGTPMDSDVQMIEFLKRKIESGKAIDKRTLDRAWDLFGGKVADNIRVARLFEWIFQYLQEMKESSLSVTT